MNEQLVSIFYEFAYENIATTLDVFDSTYETGLSGMLIRHQ